MKNLTLLCLLFISCTSYAAQEIVSGSTGNYFGFAAGTTKLNAQDAYLPDDNGNIVLVTPSSNGAGGRLFYGYQFNSYAAIETGYTYYSPATYSIPNGHSPQVRMQAIDFLGKGILPVPMLKGLSLYLKGGGAVVGYKQGGLLSPNDLDDGPSGSSGVTARPEYGLGVSYSFTPNWVVDLSATRITSGGAVPQADFISLGFSYHAVDLYCGQFLCN